MSEQVEKNDFYKVLAEQEREYLGSLKRAKELKVSDEVGLYQRIDGMAPALEKFGNDVEQFKMFLARHIGSQYLYHTGELLPTIKRVEANHDPFDSEVSLGSFQKAYGPICATYPQGVKVQCDGEKITLKFAVHPKSENEIKIFAEATHKMPQGVKASLVDVRTALGKMPMYTSPKYDYNDSPYSFSIEATSLQQLMDGYNAFLAHGLETTGAKHVKLDDIALKAPAGIAIGR